MGAASLATPPGGVSVVAKPPGLGLILVVKPNAAGRTSLRDCLAGAGYTVLEAPDGATALALVPAHRPDLIVQDLILTDIDGLELARRLHE